MPKRLAGAAAAAAGTHASLFAWLRTVAVHEAYRLSRQEWRDARLDEIVPGDRQSELGDRRLA